MWIGMELKNKEEWIVKLAVLFYITSIIGYFYELILNYINTNKFFSHGILNGPWLPIYGTGSLLIMLLLKCNKKPFVVFLLSFLVTGTLELISGFMLLKFLKMRLWDYTGYFLNINGFVCLLSALCFGIGGLLVIYVIYPLVKKIYEKINKKFLYAILIILSVIFLGDIIATIIK